MFNARSKIIKKETLSEVTDQEIAESRARQERTAIDNRLSTIERTLGELSDNLRAQNQILGRLEDFRETNIAVGVTAARSRFGRIPHSGDVFRNGQFHTPVVPGHAHFAARAG